MPTAVTRVMSSVTQPILVDRIVYATITIMSVLIIYDGWQHLRLVDVIGVIVGPVVAMFLAHVFSAALAKQVDLGRALNWNDRWAIAKFRVTVLASLRPTNGDRLSPLRVWGVAQRCHSCHAVARDAFTWILGLPRRSSRGSRGMARSDAHRGRTHSRDYRVVAASRAPARKGIFGRYRTRMITSPRDQLN